MCFNGTREQAKSTCFYTCKYCSKVPANVKHAVLIMYATQKMVEQRRSKAQDAGTAKGKLKFHTNVLTNMYTKSTDTTTRRPRGNSLGSNPSTRQTPGFGALNPAARARGGCVDR